MQYTLNVQRALRWLVLATCLSLGMGLAMAQSEPTMAEIYSTAQSGKLDQAQVMVQQVLVAHPNSAKAHYVQSELYARQGNMSRAREALASAEKLAPGLPFAKPEAVQALRAELAAKPVASSGQNASPALMGGSATNASGGKSSSSGSAGWLMPVLLAGGVIVGAYFVFRRKAQPQVFEQPAYNNGLNGPQSFGNGAAAMQPGYGPYGPGGPGYGQPQGSGLGGRIMGGVATGLAVGAGVMAAEAIGRNLMGGHDNAPRADSLGNQDFQSPSVNTDMGGQNFGVNDTSSWDDGGSVDMGGGGSGDWDT
jgi:hypothetical protein